MERHAHKGIGVLIGVVLVVLDIVVWGAIRGVSGRAYSEIDFLDVGQGDSQLLLLPGGVTALTDAGPPRSVARALDGVMPSGKRYIDLAILTHPQLDHMGGFVDLLDRYAFGAFLWNGREDAAAQDTWRLIKEKLLAKGIPMIAIRGGDAIRVDESRISFLGPDTRDLMSKELNDTGLIEYIHTPQFSALFTADISARSERALVGRFDVHTDILKVAHHGSRFSSDEQFLKEASPKIAGIGVGKNSYGHPTKDALARLASVGAKIFRTDLNGTVRVIAENGKLKVFVERNERKD